MQHVASRCDQTRCYQAVICCDKMSWGRLLDRPFLSPQTEELKSHQFITIQRQEVVERNKQDMIPPLSSFQNVGLVLGLMQNRASKTSLS